jgi:predicted ATP-dependent endonuclease of OLD family
MDLEKDLSLVIGKNNTGKTSILSILNKFLNPSEKNTFYFDDFNIDFKKELKEIIIATDTISEDNYVEIGICLNLYIEYFDEDNLSNVSRVMMDLDPNNNVIVLSFQYLLDYSNYLKLRKDYQDFVLKENRKQQEKGDYQPRSLVNFLQLNQSTYFKPNKKSLEYDNVNKKPNSYVFIDLDSEKIGISDIISFKYISAKRDVTNKEIDKTLSGQTSRIYKRTESNNAQNQAVEDFKDKLSETDSHLSGIYTTLFEDIVKKIKDFGGVRINESEIEVISTLQHRELLEGNTTVVYKHDSENRLPEHYNGLGYMNLISMIFEIEILVNEFKRDKDKKPADINLFFIEEPEAHTHPQMQYVFIKNIKKLLGSGITREDGENRKLQYIISTHSAHIVADSDFDGIKYLKRNNRGVTALNLKDLQDEYDTETTQYQFLKQYLTIDRAEIFFADKAILIEGDTERILIPTMMKKIDIEEEIRFTAIEEQDYCSPLLSQNISIIEVGAYSQIFERFIQFLGIKSLILTDIDSVKVIGQNENGSDKLDACIVTEGTASSNSAINHYLKDIEWARIKALPIDKRTISIVDGSEICICYQQEESDYHARSFEDAFIHLNMVFIKAKKDEFNGLKNRSKFDNGTGPYDLAENCIKKKTHFALDILYHSKADYSNWQIPSYIKEGLLWLKQD